MRDHPSSRMRRQSMYQAGTQRAPGTQQVPSKTAKLTVERTMRHPQQRPTATAAHGSGGRGCRSRATLRAALRDLPVRQVEASRCQYLKSPGHRAQKGSDPPQSSDRAATLRRQTDLASCMPKRSMQRLCVLVSVSCTTGLPQHTSRAPCTEQQPKVHELHSWGPATPKRRRAAGSRSPTAGHLPLL